MTTESAPTMRDGDRAGERRDRKRHRHPVIAARVGLTGARGRSCRPAPTTKPSGTLVGRDAEGAEPGDERRDAVAFLDAQLARRRGR